MAQDFPSPTPPLQEPKKTNNTLVIIIIVLVVILCCCLLLAGAAYYLWTYGDQIFGLTPESMHLLNLFA